VSGFPSQPLVYPFVDLPQTSFTNNLLSDISTKLTTLINGVNKLASTVNSGEEIKVSITSIPTEEAIVVTNNIAHPALDVIVVV